MRNRNLVWLLLTLTLMELLTLTNGFGAYGNPITPTLSDPSSGPLPVTLKDDAQRVEKFALAIVEGYSPHKAALLAGYAETTAQGRAHALLCSPRVMKLLEQYAEHMPAVYKTRAKLNLPAISEIESKALERYAADPDKAIDRPGLLKQIKQAAGALESDAPQISMTFVSNIQQMVSAVYDEEHVNKGTSDRGKRKARKPRHVVDI